MRINQNIMAFNAYRNLSATNNAMGKGLEKLSSGYRINRAADDAAGLVISQGLRAQISGLTQATRNAQDGISVVQTAEGALQEVHTMLQRVRDLAVQASNTGSNDPDARTAAQSEVDQLTAEIDRISARTKFGSQALLDGTFGVKYESAGTAYAFTDTTVATGTFTLTIGGTDYSITVATGTYESAASVVSAVNSAIEEATGNSDTKLTSSVSEAGVTFKLVSSHAITVVNAGTLLTGANLADSSQTGSGGSFQVGANVGDTLSVSIDAMSSSVLEIDALDLVNDASAALTKIDAAISSVSTQRGNLGAYQNRLESVVSSLQVTTENLTASESRIRDTDMAREMVSFTRHQILLQAGTAMLSQANAVPQTVLQLLK